MKTTSKTNQKQKALCETPVMSMTVKAYLDKGSENPEIRRFAVDQSVSASLAYLDGKITQVFPSLTNTRYNLFWKGI